jgi:predicted NBD/HSP70 family sugar kinase
MYILADIGGTKTRIAASEDLISLGEAQVMDTPQEYEAGVERLIQCIKALSPESVEAVAVGLPGIVWDDHSTVLDSNVPAWNGKPLRRDLEARLNAPALLRNDASLNALGEATHGAGVGSRIMMYLTVSTGINGARVVDGKLDEATVGFEVGRQYLSFDEPMVKLKDLVSGSAIQKKYGAHPRDLGKEHPVWEDLARYTAIGLHNSMMHWSPDRIVLGGSMFNEIGIPLERVRFHLAALSSEFPVLPELVHGSLGETSGLWGGLALLRSAR